MPGGRDMPYVEDLGWDFFASSGIIPSQVSHGLIVVLLKLRFDEFSDILEIEAKQIFAFRYLPYCCYVPGIGTTLEASEVVKVPLRLSDNFLNYRTKTR
jgi:hypothetical protein